MSKAISPATRLAFARNVKRHIQESEISEAELARRAGVSQKHVNNATNCRTTSSIEVAECLGRALLVPGWALCVPGLHSESRAQTMALAGLVASWIGASDDARKTIEDVARRVRK